MTHMSTYPTHPAAMADWKVWGEPVLHTTLEAFGFVIDPTRCNQRSGGFAVIAEGGTVIPVEIHPRKSPSSSRFNSRFNTSYAIRDFAWKVDPNYGEASNRPRKVKVGADGTPSFEDLVAAIKEACAHLKAKAEATRKAASQKATLEAALLARGYTKGEGSSWSEQDLAPYINGYQERRLDSPVFFRLDYATTGSLYYFKDGLRYDAAVGVDENSPLGFFVSKVTVTVCPKCASLVDLFNL